MPLCLRSPRLAHRSALKDHNWCIDHDVRRPDAHDRIKSPSEVPVDAEHAIEEDQEGQFHEIQPNNVDESLCVGILIVGRISLLTSLRPMAGLTFRNGTNHVCGTSHT